MAMTIEELQVLITAETKGLRKSLEAVKTQFNSIAKKVNENTSHMGNSLMKVEKHVGHVRHGFMAMYKDMLKMSVVMAAVTATFAPFYLAVKGVQDAMKFEASIGQINRLMGLSGKVFSAWANANAAAFGMGRSEAIRYGAVYANLLSSFTSSTAQTAQYTQDLLKASAVVASGTGRSIQDVMERIRSGLLGNTEAIEDLGINVYINMIEATEAFRRFAGDKSWDQLDFQTQLQIRYFAILEQATKKYGDEIADNTAPRQAKFIAQLKDAQLALGQAFLPIYNIVLPALTRMAAALANALRFLAAFSQALFGSSVQQTKALGAQSAAVNGVGKAYQDAGKKAKGALTGFDEINQLALQSGDAGNSTEGAMPLDMVAPIGDSSGLTAPMEEVALKAQEMAERVKMAFGEMTAVIQERKDLILAALAGLAAGFATFLIISRWAAIISAFETLYLIGLYAIDGLKLAWAALTGPIGLIVLAVAAAVAAFVYFYRTNETFRGFVDGILQKIGDVALWLWDNVLVPFGQWMATVFVAAWDGVKVAAQWLWQNVLVPLGDYLIWLWNNALLPIAGILVDVFGVAFGFATKAALIFWKNVMVPLGEFFAAVFIPLIDLVAAIVVSLWKDAFTPLVGFLAKELKPILAKIGGDLEWLWKNILKPIAIFVGGVFLEAFDDTFRFIGGLINGLKDIFVGILTFLKGIFLNDWTAAWLGIKQVFKGVFDSFALIIKTPLNSVIDSINTVIDALNSLNINIPDWVPGFGGKTWGVSIPKIPKLARGGIIDSPTLAMIGEAGKEVVVPLENTSFVNTLASAIGTAVLNAMMMGGSNGNRASNEGTTEFILNLEGTPVARILLPFIIREQQRIGTSAIIQPD